MSQSSNCSFMTNDNNDDELIDNSNNGGDASDGDASELNEENIGNSITAADNTESSDYHFSPSHSPLLFPEDTTAQIVPNASINPNYLKRPNIAGKIFVGGLSKITTSEKLKRYFQEFGTVRESIVIKTNEKSVKSRGFGFVTFSDPKIIDTLLEMDHYIDQKRVEIRKAIPKENIEAEPLRQKLFVGGLPRNIDSSEFRNHFLEYGEIHESNLIFEKNGNGKGFGFVTFRDDSVNPKVLADSHIILGKKVDVRIAESKRSHQQHPSQHQSTDDSFSYSEYENSNATTYIKQEVDHSQQPSSPVIYSISSVIMTNKNMTVQSGLSGSGSFSSSSVSSGSSGNSVTYGKANSIGSGSMESFSPQNLGSGGSASGGKLLVSKSGSGVSSPPSPLHTPTSETPPKPGAIFKSQSPRQQNVPPPQNTLNQAGVIPVSTSIVQSSTTPQPLSPHPVYAQDDVYAGGSTIYDYSQYYPHHNVIMVPLYYPPYYSGQESSPPPPGMNIPAHTMKYHPPPHYAPHIYGQPPPPSSTTVINPYHNQHTGYYTPPQAQPRYIYTHPDGTHFIPSNYPPFGYQYTQDLSQIQAPQTSRFNPNSNSNKKKQPKKPPTSINSTGTPTTTTINNTTTANRNNVTIQSSSSTTGNLSNETNSNLNVNTNSNTQETISNVKATISSPKNTSSNSSNSQGESVERSL